MLEVGTSIASICIGAVIYWFYRYKKKKKVS
jgi:cbb3-type cytochrome oxidase subunit 3